MASLDDANVSLHLRVEAPEWWMDPNFFEYVKRADVYAKISKNDPSDAWNTVIVMVEPDLLGGGSNEDMPHWDELLELLRNSPKAAFFQSSVTNLSIRIDNGEW